jgi:Arc/MetJ family transcription regulator
MRMRTTLNLDDKLVETARKYTGIQRKTALVHEALLRLVRGGGGKAAHCFRGDDAGRGCRPEAALEKNPTIEAGIGFPVQ